MSIVSLPDAEATADLAAGIAGKLPNPWSGWMILLQGDLGAGKSTFARAMLQSLGHCGPVPSPTYTLVEPYTLSGGTVYHIDLYRISGFDELEFLGWQDMRDGLVVLEWPERAPELMARADLLLKLEYDGAGRTAELKLVSDRAQALFESIV